MFPLFFACFAPTYFLVSLKKAYYHFKTRLATYSYWFENQITSILHENTISPVTALWALSRTRYSPAELKYRFFLIWADFLIPTNTPVFSVAYQELHKCTVNRGWCKVFFTFPWNRPIRFWENKYQYWQQVIDSGGEKIRMTTI